ncbi:hypothetical protein CHU32_00305 [Superficieibacter electus]|uniref:Phosphodiester glycosidase domain-containing protein n=1 Tax=Superficieibacter electus TaxID=2022662 RepID=A0A2P5GVR6_9ENTR|nr:phosphodiester glycosidase family protein [Superficieibacter electus]POP47630.1 hypothetical protein CHU33_00305 [Superficieibacter electus]POP50641.1 hypothetical protein CHU32_00305 [Superficieibacter electus]
MKSRLLLSIAIASFPLCALASDCTLSDPALTVQSYKVNPSQERIVMYWKKTDGTAWGSLQNLLADINTDGRVKMVMNGGIYAKSYVPLGLYIEQGKRLASLNRASGGGNFFIRPGGVFYVKGQQAGIVSLDKFKTSRGMDYAVQSGPLMIENGIINRRLLPSASSRKIRNAVGITAQGQAVFMLSDRETNFYDFACYARIKLNVRNMLYLDGTISRMYQKGNGVPWQYHPFVTMIAVESRHPDQ